MELDPTHFAPAVADALATATSGDTVSVRIYCRELSAHIEALREDDNGLDIDRGLENLIGALAEGGALYFDGGHRSCPRCAVLGNDGSPDADVAYALLESIAEDVDVVWYTPDDHLEEEADRDRREAFNGGEVEYYSGILTYELRCDDCEIVLVEASSGGDGAETCACCAERFDDDQVIHADRDGIRLCDSCATEHDLCPGPKLHRLCPGHIAARIEHDPVLGELIDTFATGHDWVRSVEFAVRLTELELAPLRSAQPWWPRFIDWINSKWQLPYLDASVGDHFDAIAVDELPDLFDTADALLADDLDWSEAVATSAAVLA